MAIPRIKICGIQNAHEAELCLRSGADSLGFLLELTHKAEDKITTEQAKDIISKLPPETNTVMVTHSLDWKKIVEVAKETKVKAIQIHDDLPIDGIIQLINALPEITLLKAVHIPFADSSPTEKEAAVQKAEALAEYVDGLLLDSRTKDRLGGTGLVHDWEISRQIVQRVKKPVILAGGINPDNTEQSILQTGCYGIDVNSGVENDLGAKDPQKVKAYCQRSAQALGLEKTGQSIL